MADLVCVVPWITGIFPFALVNVGRERMLAASSELLSQVLEEKIFSRAAYACESLETAV